MEKRYEFTLLNISGPLWWWAIVLFLCGLLLTGCKTVEYVPVTVVEHKTDSIYFTKVVYDSIYVKDSTSQKEFSSGDTIYIVRDKWQTLYKYKLVHDTLYQSKKDSIPVPYPVTEYVEKKLSKPQKGLMTVGFISLIGLLLFIVSKVKRFLP